jgi:branched-chain amino acid transport system permease protein
MTALQIYLQTAVSGLLFGSVYGLIAFGLTLVFALTRLLNFAHGSFMLFAMYVSLALNRALHLDPYASILLDAPLLFLIGLVLYRYMFARMMDSHLIMVVQLTLGLVFVIEGLLQMTFTADPVTVPTVISSSKLYLHGIIVRTPLLVAFVVAVSLSIMLYWMLHRTDFGRFIRASAQDPVAAKLVGVNVERVRVLAFALAIGLLGIAGPLAIPMWVLEPSSGLELTLFAFIVIVLGGLGSFVGAFIGGLLLGVAEAFGNLLLPGTLAPIVPYVLFVVVLLFKPDGLMGEA